MASSSPHNHQQTSGIEPPLHATPSASHRFHILDALRGIAALFVVCWHTPGYLAVRSTHSTFLAVDFFFGLSGFVIAFSYEQRLKTSLTFARFFLARWIRLYPVYILGCLLGTLTFLYLRIDSSISFLLLRRLVAMLLLQYAMLPNLHVWDIRLLFPLNYPSWSMFFEVVANLGYAALLRARIATTGVLVALYLTSLTVMVWWTRTHVTVDVGWLNATENLWGGLARVTLSFIAGVLILRIYRAFPRPSLTGSTSVIIAIAVAVVLSLLLLTPIGFMQSKSFQMVTIALLFPALVYSGSLCRSPRSWTKICAFLGDISYPMYLLHTFVFTVVALLPFTMRFWKSHPRAQVVVVPAVLLITAAVSFTAVKYYDAPLRAFLTRKFNPRLTVKSEAAPQ